MKKIKIKCECDTFGEYVCINCEWKIECLDVIAALMTLKLLKSFGSTRFYDNAEGITQKTSSHRQWSLVGEWRAHKHTHTHTQIPFLSLSHKHAVPMKFIWSFQSQLERYGCVCARTEYGCNVNNRQTAKGKTNREKKYETTCHTIVMAALKRNEVKFKWTRKTTWTEAIRNFWINLLILLV